MLLCSLPRRGRSGPADGQDGPVSREEFTAFPGSARSPRPILPPDPQEILAGIARSRLTRRVPLKVRLPITAPILAQLHGNLTQSSRPDRVLIWAVAATAFFGFFRLGELLVDAPKNYSPATKLSWGDVSVDDRASPTMVKIHLRQSKCDQFGKGVEVIIGRTDTPTCPIAALTTYISHRQDVPGAFFLTKGGSPATKSWFVDQIREVLSSIGLPQSDYAGHSFWIGAATTAALAGVEDSTIQALGR